MSRLERYHCSEPDTSGVEESVIFSEVSSFQRLKEWHILWVGKGVNVSEVSSFLRLKCMQEWYLGWEKVSSSVGSILSLSP